MIKLYQGDCLEIMPTLPVASVDLVLCDLPYGTTTCKWDAVIPFAPLWDMYKRAARKGAAYVFTASQPFTTALVSSNLTDFRYAWVWRKERPTNFMQGKRQPLKYHEDIAVFYESQCTYNPQLTAKEERNKRNNSPRSLASGVMGITDGGYAERCVTGGSKDWLYPGSIQYFSMQRGLHPTQKPVALMEYLIRTYTNPGDTVLDNCMGSGTTGVACVNTGRNFIGIEKDSAYFSIAEKRINDALGDINILPTTEEKIGDHTTQGG